MRTSNQELEPLKSKSFWFTLFAKSFDTLSTLRWFPMVWIPSSQDRRQKLPHFWVSVASRVQLCDLGSAYQIHIQRYRYRSDFCVEAGGMQGIHFSGTDCRRGSVVLESSGAENPFSASSAQRFWGLFLEAHSKACFFSSSQDSVKILISFNKSLPTLTW